MRLAYVDSLETNVKTREYSVDSLKQELLSRQSELTDQESANITNLAKLFNSMKPEQAATVVLQLPDQTAVEILYQMKEREAGKLIEQLAQSDPVRAADITERYKRLVPPIKK
jgi:flagellar motility protein MotE (MotC chaperone)